MGDSSDNIPGVGVGEKTAQALLQGLGGLDNSMLNQTNCRADIAWCENHGGNSSRKRGGVPLLSIGYYQNGC
ncbi:hypothetical protein ACNKHK_25140 [Shigella flexneri]